MTKAKFEEMDRRNVRRLTRFGGIFSWAKQLDSRAFLSQSHTVLIVVLIVRQAAGQWMQ